MNAVYVLLSRNIISLLRGILAHRFMRNIRQEPSTYKRQFAKNSLWYNIFRRKVTIALADSFILKQLHGTLESENIHYYYYYYYYYGLDVTNTVQYALLWN